MLVLVLPWVESIGTRPPHDTPVAARIRQLAREEGVGGTPVRIENVHGETTAANAMSTGIGPSARVFIWDTFLDGRYSAREIEVVAAHEFGHVAHRHIWKGLAWSLLLTVPGFWIVERATRRRGGLERPEVVPYALLVLALIGLVVTPFGNAVSRRYEGEADWSALRATRDPQAAESVFRKFTRYDLVQPNPPLWSYIWIDNHPTVVQRIAMARAYAARALRVVAGRRLGEIADPLPGRPLRPRVLHRVEQLAHEPARHVHARDDHARDVALLDLVVDARERERELVVREADVREVGVDPGEVLGVEMDVELALLVVAFHASTILLA